MKIEIRTPMVSLNKYVEAERRNRFIAAKIKQTATDGVAWETKQHAGKLTEFPVDVHFEWHVTANRGKWLDHDNVAFARKFILDGLVDAGVLPNDNKKYVGDFSDKFIDDAEQYVILEIG